MASDPDEIRSICRRQLPLTDTVCLPNLLPVNTAYLVGFRVSDKLSSAVRARVAVMYFMVKSCIHTVRRPELHQNMP